MADLTNVFGGSFRPARKVSAASPEDQLKEAIANADLTVPEDIRMDGQIHRFSTNGKTGDSAGWYVVYPDGIPAGRFGCWRDGVEVTWRAQTDRELSAAEQMQVTRKIADAKKRREEEQKRTHERAADTVEKIWQNSGAASSDHPYLVKKGVDNHGARITGDGRLVLPLFNDSGELSSLQYIGADGDKKYHPGGKAKGATWQIGSKKETIYIAEGYATAASIFEATGQTVIISYTANNLVHAAKLARATYGATQKIVIVGDNDESGTGQKAAKEAAEAIGARYVLPPQTGDANDYAQSGGNLNDLLSPQVEDWLVTADSFSQQPSPLRWLVKGWLQENALIMVHGPSGGGKTFTVLDWCLSMAGKKEQWCDHKVKPGNVVYLAGEGHHGLRGRIAAWKQHNKVGALSMWLSKSGCDLNTADGYQKVVQNIEHIEQKPDLIVVDTLHRFLQGDENSAQDAKTMLDACGTLMHHFGCSVLLVHHTGVSDEAQHRARGSSAWRGALDIEISVKPGKDDSPMELIQRKSKDSEPAAPIYGDLVSVPIKGWFDEDDEPVTSAVFEQVDEPKKADKKGSKLSANIKMVNRAWWKGGAETDKSGRPYIVRSVLKSMLEEDGWSDSNVKINLLPSQNERLIGSLINGGIIEPSDHGWAVIDENTASQWRLSKP